MGLTFGVNVGRLVGVGLGVIGVLVTVGVLRAVTVGLGVLCRGGIVRGGGFGVTLGKFKPIASLFVIASWGSSFGALSVKGVTF